MKGGTSEGREREMAEIACGKRDPKRQIVIRIYAIRETVKKSRVGAHSYLSIESCTVTYSQKSI